MPPRASAKQAQAWTKNAKVVLDNNVGATPGPASGKRCGERTIRLNAWADRGAPRVGGLHRTALFGHGFCTCRPTRPGRRWGSGVAQGVVAAHPAVRAAAAGTAHQAVTAFKGAADIHSPSAACSRAWATC